MARLLFVFVFILSASSSHAIDKNYYLKGDLGIAAPGNKMKRSSGYMVDKGAKISPQLSLGVGYNATEQLRFDCSYTLMPNFKYRGILTSAGQQLEQKQKTKAHVVMLSGYYHFLKPEQIFSPFIGAGVGVAAIDHNTATTSSNRTSATLTNKMKSSTNPAVSGIAGMSIAYTDDLFIDWCYKYLYMSQFKGFNQVMTSSGTINVNTKKNKFTTHNVSLGMRYNF